MFAFEKYDVVPDILTLSKTLGAGLPLGATITTSEIERVCSERGFFYYTTHLNDPLVCAVGAKVCEIVVRDGMALEAKRKGKILKDGLYAVGHFTFGLPSATLTWLAASGKIPVYWRCSW
jgi:2,2-dialkylglycine decarboxylase (pyruvate)